MLEERSSISKMFGNTKTKIYAVILEKFQDNQFRVFFQGKKVIDADNKFHHGEHSYLVDNSKLAFYDKKRNPVFFFVYGNALTASIVENDNHGIKPSSAFFDHMFRRHLWRDSITSALKENKAIGWKEALPFMLGAGGICLVIGIELAKYIA